MCRIDLEHGRTGASLCDGQAHVEDHRNWSRRAFIHTLGLSLAGSAGVLSGLPVRTFGRTRGLTALERSATDRVLVLVQLNGGNDGLNTVIPYRQDPYFSKRPTIAVDYREILQITRETGLHPALTSFRNRFDDGSLAIVQGVGYAEPNLSHFRSTDIWLSGQSGFQLPDSGWVGRSLLATWPDFDSDPPDYPLAVQFGGTSPLLTLGPDAQMGMSVQSIDLFERLATTGQVYRTEDLLATPGGDELRFVRTVANDSFRYAGALQAANSRVENDAPYPSGNALAAQLAIVSRLIRGRLGARIYHVSLNGFDTHSNQAGQHQALLTTLADAVEAFLADLAVSGDDERVMVATFSEFGRRVAENGSAGTDHGTAAPLFLIGPGVRGGLHGDHPDLADLDQGGNLRFGVDYRTVFGSILQDWFGMPGSDVAGVMGAAWPTLPIVSSPTSTSRDPAVPYGSIVLDAPWPNPFTDTTTIRLHLDSSVHVSAELLDVTGRTVTGLVNARLDAGSHVFRVGSDRLASGTYFIRVSTPNGVLTRSAVLVR